MNKEKPTAPAVETKPTVEPAAPAVTAQVSEVGLGILDVGGYPVVVKHKKTDGEFVEILVKTN